MDTVEELKSWARQIREQQVFPWLRLSHGHALEIIVSLVSSANSWNEYSALPIAFKLPETVESYFGAVCRTQRRLHALEVAPAATRAGRCYAAVHLLAILNRTPDQPYKMPWELLGAAGTDVPIVVGVDRRKMEASLETYFPLRLSTWFFSQHLGPHRRAGHYPWDETERVALSMGFSPSNAALVREIQREAPNHSWDLFDWFEAGVLDPDQEAFLRELQSQPNWQDDFDKLLRSDGGRFESEDAGN